MGEFIIGSLVVAKLHPNLNTNSSNESIYYNSSIENVPDDVPVMIVREINSNSKRDNKFNVQFGEDIGPIKDEDKYLCSWYDNELGVFKDKFFYKNQIVLVPVKSKRFSADTIPRIGTKVYLAANELEMFKFYANLTSKAFRFKSPVLVILDYKRVEEPIVFDPKTGKKIKVCDEIIAKCQWFNSKSGKYSEEWLPLSSLCSVDFIHEMPFKFLSDEDKEVCKAIEAGNHSYRPTMQAVEQNLGITESPNRSLTQKRGGRKHEWTIFHSNTDVVLNPRFDEFILQKGWDIKDVKAFVYNDDKYGQVDIIAERNNHTFIVDVIKSFSLEKSVASRWANNATLNDDEHEIEKALDKYWNRIVMHKQMLETKYAKRITSCYLLIDYRDKESPDLFIVDRNRSVVPAQPVTEGQPA